MHVVPKPQRTLQVHAPGRLEIWLRDFLLDVCAANRIKGPIKFYRVKLKRFLTFLQAQNV